MGREILPLASGIQFLLNAVFKTALVEVMEERRDLIRDAVEDALEEIVLARAIEAGKESETVSRDEVFELLNRS